LFFQLFERARRRRKTAAVAAPAAPHSPRTLTALSSCFSAGEAETAMTVDGGGVAGDAVVTGSAAFGAGVVEFGAAVPTARAKGSLPAAISLAIATPARPSAAKTIEDS
jgi:hypothetical protein